jgi:hypothetical protein
MTNKSKEITYFLLFLQVLLGCIYPDMGDFKKNEDFV